MTEANGANPFLRSKSKKVMANKTNFIEMNVDDALIEKPHCFSLEAEDKGVRHFYLYPVTLGKLHLLKRHIDNLDINLKQFARMPFHEAIRIVRKHRNEVCRIITYHTMKKKRDIFNYDLVEERVSLIDEMATEEDLATLLIVILNKDDIESFKNHLSITKENERMRKVAEAKKKAQKSQNNFEFGGKSIYGTLIDTACERYGWSYDYVLWGISLINLQLLLADRMQSIYLTDEEKKKVSSGLLNGSGTINADDKSNMEKILAMNWR